MEQQAANGWSLTRRFALATAGVAALSVVAVGMSAWWYARTELARSFESSLQQEAAVAGERVSGLIAGVSTTMAALAENSLLATALVDSSGKETYLIPFLAGFQHVNGLPVDIVFTDFEGKVIATSSHRRPAPADLDWLRAALSQERPGAVIREDVTGPYLLTAEFLSYSRTNTPEGALMYRYPLTSLMPREHARLRYNGDGGTASAEPVRIEGDTLVVTRPVAVPPRLEPMGLRIEIAVPAGSAGPSSERMAVFFLVAGALVLVLVMVVSRAAGRRMTGDLRQLQSFAATVVAEGLSERRAPVHRMDEVAGVARGINYMLDRMAEMYAELESESRQRIRVERERLAWAQELARLGNWDYEPATGTIEWSSEVYRMYGFDEGEPPTTDRIVLATVPEDRDQLHGHFADPRDGASFEHRIRHTGGEIRTMAVTIGHVERDAAGTPVRVLGVIQDVTERKQAERALADKTRELERSNAELEAFAYVASHDLRQPLRMVASYVTLLEQDYADKLDDTAREFIGFARDGAKRMDRLIVDLLEYSRVGRKNDARRLNMDEVVGDALIDLARAIEDAEAEVTVRPGIPELVGRRGELVRLFQNLIGNAIKYRHRDRAPRVEITWRTEGQEVEIAVRDNGIGIDPEHHQRVFGIFQRLHREEFEGTGIGLAVCKKIVESHGGRIWLDSAPDEGTTVKMAFPNAQAATANFIRAEA